VRKRSWSRGYPGHNPKNSNQVCGLKKPVIVADENIALAGEYFSRIADVETFKGRLLNASHIRHADALLVRSVTQVNEALLSGSKVKFVGTATAGVDHLDCDYLSSHGIPWASAAGSNATSVVEYVISALCTLPGLLELLLDGGRVGIVGMGNVGGQLYRRLNALGISCRAYDPLIPDDSFPILTSLEQVLRSDAICLHMPLTCEGDFPTRHMIGTQQLKKLGPDIVLLNAGRGEVIDNQALHRQLAQGHGIQLVMDVWQNEPDIDLTLLHKSALSTPHIAGYSIDGKLKSTEIIYCAYCRLNGFPPGPRAERGEQGGSRIQGLAEACVAINPDLHGAELIRAAVLSCYDISTDDRRMREAVLQGGKAASLAFDQLRKSYPPRREFSAFRIANLAGLDNEQRVTMSGLGFGQNFARLGNGPV